MMRFPPPVAALPLTLPVTVTGLWCVVRLLELASPLHRPWTPAQLSALDGPATAWQLASVRDDPRWCRAVLTAGRTPFALAADRRDPAGCALVGTIRLTGRGWSPAGPLVTCPLALALTLWRRQSVDPAARDLLGGPLKTIAHYGTYSCRVIAGTDRQSEHAAANAIDIAAFVPERGRPVTVRGDWNPPGTRGR